MKENSIEDRINNAYCFLNSMHSDFRTGLYYKEDLENLEHILSDYKRVLKMNEVLLKENEKYKKQYFCLINRIENKIDKFDYEFEKAKRKNDNDRADYYWDLIRNFKKMLESEE